MEKKAASSIMVTLLLIGMLTFAFNIQFVEGEPRTWTVDDDGPADFSSIQEAVNAAMQADIVYVRNGTYNENVVLNKALTLTGESKEATVINGSGTSTVVYVTASNVKISMFTIQGSGDWPHSGIHLDTSDNSTVSDNLLRTNNRGLHLYYSTNSKISNNAFINNTYGGITVWWSENNNISWNNLSNQGQLGVELWYSKNNSIIENEVTGNFGSGIGLDRSDENIVFGNVVSDHFFNIALYESDRNTLIKNTVTNVGCDGGCGIDLSSSDSNVLRNNNMKDNGYGIQVYELSNSNLICDNVISNGKMGYSNIRLAASGNLLVGNTILNGWTGISVDSRGYDNEIFHNNFINNIVNQAYVFGSSANSWDDGYPSGGNYWSDYTFRFPFAQELDDSGIWDTPYVIGANNQDNYPLMEPWTPTPPTIMATVDVDPDTLNLQSNGRWIAAYIQLPEGYNAEDIDASTILLNGTISPVLDPKYGFVTNSSEYLVDFNNDGILERMVKFNKTEVASWIHDDLGIQYGNVTLTITGELYDGTSFEATYTVKVLFPGDADNDGDVDFNDFIILASCHGCYTGTPNYNQLADFNEDETIDFNDFIILAGNYGKTAV